MQDTAKRLFPCVRQGGIERALGLSTDADRFQSHTTLMNRKLKFTIAEGPIHWRTHRIMELCEYLTENVLEPMFKREGATWNRRFMDFVTFDNTCNPLEPTGTIYFAVPPLFAGQLGQIEEAIRTELSRLKIKTGEFVYTRDPVLNTIKSVAIPVLENPTALLAPPDVNMSQTRGCLVLRDLLGYQKVNGRYEFASEDLVKRVSSVTEDKIAACTASPVKVSQEIRRTPSPVSMKAIRRCLEEVRQFGLWAMRNKYSRLAAV